MIKNICLILFSLGLSVGGRAQIIGISGPDGLLKVTFTMNNGQANYDVKYNSRQIMESSPLGIVTSAGDFGPVLLNQKHNRENNGGTERRTTEIFQLATAVLFQASVQNFGITPNNLTECPDFVIDFMKKVPTTWEETIFIDGYPGKYAVLARKSSGKWYVTGINAEKESKKLKLKLPMLADKNVVLYSDKKDRTSRMEKKKISKNGEIEVSILSGGGMIITGE